MCSLQTEENYLASMAFALPTDEIPPAQTTLFDISWQDVLIPLVAEFLSLKDLFNLRCCSQTAKRFVESAFELRKDINLAWNNSRNVELAFAVLGKCCRRVESLHLACCHWLTDDYLLPILAEKTRLRVVNLNGCVNITPLALQPIIFECKELRVLKLGKCQWLTTGAVDALTLRHSNLVEFDISHCTAIEERFLMIFFQKLNKINDLSLANTQSVTNQVLIQIANCCRGLEHINLVGCAAISDYGIYALIKGCKKLHSLMVQRCPYVTECVLAPLRGRIFIDRQQLEYHHRE
ncbi:F-box/LRR-repeat protein 15-like isoform X2 [Eurosta solidaginis]|uniref:F-box/LRR-repeat protein 15-like isoform X2 n=1 Tax=Eurosta solidaginis TaxID=178769 RepID=UPI0035312285